MCWIKIAYEFDIHLDFQVSEDNKAPLLFSLM